MLQTGARHLPSIPVRSWPMGSIDLRQLQYNNKRSKYEYPRPWHKYNNKTSSWEILVEGVVGGKNSVIDGIDSLKVAWSRAGVVRELASRSVTCEKEKKKNN